jgi:hypothetical protein
MNDSHTQEICQFSSLFFEELNDEGTPAFSAFQSTLSLPLEMFIAKKCDLNSHKI